MSVAHGVLAPNNAAESNASIGPDRTIGRALTFRDIDISVTTIPVRPHAGCDRIGHARSDAR